VTDPTVLIVFITVLGCVLSIAKHLHEASKDAQLRKNPEIWLRNEELKAAEKQRQHERKQAGMKVGGNLGMILLRVFLGK